MMEGKLDLLENRLSPDACKVWMIKETIGNIIYFAVLGLLFFLDYYFAWKAWIGLVIIILTVLSVPITILSYIWTFFSYKNWRYDVSEEYLKMKSGALVEEYKIVPMTKIQSVATNQGPLLRKYGLYNLTVETMGSSHMIPALPTVVANELRNRIAEYAKLKEVD